MHMVPGRVDVLGEALQGVAVVGNDLDAIPVSYTHLTLPTSDLV